MKSILEELRKRSAVVSGERGMTTLELVIVLAVIAVLIAVAVPNIIEYVSDADRTVCTENQANLEVEIARYKAAHPGTPLGPAGARLSDPEARPDAAGLLANSPNPEKLERMLLCPEAGEDGRPLGWHYAYSDEAGHIECAVDNAGMVRSEEARFNHDRFNADGE
ncbi:MAG TPA: type II secretion system protein [Candidatus Coatesbacteria bacterium]|nr:type II secretion system protein [Candidatus Coatesbacteria bacterium]